MDERRKFFEDLLSSNSSSKSPGIYGERNLLPEEKFKLTTQDVISNVAATLKAIQKADRPKFNQKEYVINKKSKDSSFVPVNLLLHDEDEHKSKLREKFETQCVSDTQLIAMLEKAENNIQIETGTHNDIIKEFETDFDGTPLLDNERLRNGNTSPERSKIEYLNFKSQSTKRGDEIICTEDNLEDNIFFALIDVAAQIQNNDNISPKRSKSEDLNNSKVSGSLSNFKTQSTKRDEETYICTGHNLEDDIFCSPIEKNTQTENGPNTKIYDFTDDISYKHIKTQTNENCETDATEYLNRPTSPIIQTHKKVIPNVMGSPLVYKLEAFENFEHIAMPLLSSGYEDLEAVKHLINSQILGKELVIQNNSQPLILNSHNSHGSPIRNKKDSNVVFDESERTSPVIEMQSLERIDFEIKACPMFNGKASKVLQTYDDEILFSSDEEVEYVNKSIHELPLTCALETSFYTNQSNVLEKTMYDGLPTSNKAVEINKESIDNIVERSNNKIISLMELVDLYDEGNKTNLAESEAKDTIAEDIENVVIKSNRGHLVVDRPCTKYNKGFDSQIEKSSKDKEMNNKEFVGFKTASCKNIKLSEKALSRVQLVFQDIDVGNKTVSEFNKKKLDQIGNEIQLDKKMKDNIEIQKLTNNRENSVKTIESDEVKTHLIDEDLINAVLFEEFVVKSEEIEVFQKNIAYDDIDLKLNTNRHHRLKKCSSAEKLDIVVPAVVGFSTASNKNINISEKALLKSKKVFRDIDVNLDTISDSCVGNLNSKNNCKEYSDTVIRASNFCAGNKKQTDIPQKLDGFKAHTKSVFEDESEKEDDFKENIFETKPFDDTENLLDMMIKKSKANEFSFNKNAEIIQNSRGSQHIQGFRTASNKIIHVSTNALATSKHIFDSIDNINEVGDTVSNFKGQGEISVDKGFQSASNKDIMVPTNAVPETKGLFHDLDTIPDLKKPESANLLDPKHTLPTLQGFRTASNKNISISATALAKTKKIFEAINKLRDCSEQNISSSAEENNALQVLKLKGTDLTDMTCEEEERSKSPVIGFQTASNKPVYISEEALARTKQKYLDECDGNMINLLQTKSLIFKGFQTASNKEVKISEHALAISKKILQNVEEFDDEKVPELTGLPKTTNIEIKNSKSPKNYKISLDVDTIENDHLFQTADLLPSFKRFQTASNQPIKISEKALERTKYIFQGIDDKDSDIFQENKLSKEGNANQYEKKIPKFKGFQTASSKPVKISTEALAKTRNIFQGIDSLEDIRDNVTHSKGRVPQFTGFHTASEKKVKISDDALANSRKIFQGVNPTKPNNEENDNFLRIMEVLPLFEGFQTDKNKPVKVSEKALKEYKNLFEIDALKEFNLKNNNDEVPECKGFQKANNKPVKISKEALAKTRDIFRDIDVLNHSSDNAACRKEELPKFKGFQTASKKAVVISDEALAKSKKILSSDQEKVNLTSLKDDKFKTPLKGFQTASKKRVNISMEAIVKTKQLFQDIDDSEEPPFRGFQTASDKTVEVCEVALSQAKEMLKDFDGTADDEKKRESPYSDFKTRNKNVIKVSEDVLKKSRKAFAFMDEQQKIKKNRNNFNGDENAYIDTQVLNNFNETLCTEDFCEDKTPNKSKRSGSPILSCPKAKKRKSFQTPYKSEIKKDMATILPKPTPLNGIKFNENYKKDKKMTLKDVDALEKQSKESVNIDPYITNIDFNDLLKFKFNEQRNGLTNSDLSVENLKTLFNESVKKIIIPDGWLDNHIKLILWKLISYEIKFPKTLAFVCSARNVIDQLKHRYDRELHNVERPALRKILEKDESSTTTIILCVVKIIENSVDVKSVTNPSSTVELCLTDGWYCVTAALDTMLTRLVTSGKIAVGSKIATSGAELVGCEQGIAPWEDTSRVRLKLSGNGTRRARWWQRLGRGGAPPCARLSAVAVDGGRVPRCRLLLTRVYPPLYVDKCQDGSTVTRSERLELLYQTKYESERQAMMEKIYEEVEREFRDEDSQDSEEILSLGKRSCPDIDSQMVKKMRKGPDPLEFGSLTRSQSTRLYDRSVRKREKLLEDIHKRVQEKLEERGQSGRQVLALLRTRVIGECGQGEDVCRGMLSIWKPTEAVSELLQEGAWVEAAGVVPTAVRYSEIQLSAGRQTIFQKAKVKETEEMKRYIKCMARRCTSIETIVRNPSARPEYNEVDVVGLIFAVEPITTDFEKEPIRNQHFQNVFLTDEKKNFISLNFWGGIKKFGYEFVLETGQIVACANVQARAGNTRKSVPQFRATELSQFTKTPKNVEMRKSVEDMVKNFNGIDRRKFCDDCVELKVKYNDLRYKSSNNNISPYRFNNSDVNMSKNKIFIDSPLAPLERKELDDLNLTGLDFESTFQQKETQEASPEVLLRKKRVSEKIAKLKMYGEPPPLSPIQIINRSKNASSSYKSPFGTESERVLLDSPKTTIDSKKSTNMVENVTSPVLNRTFVKKATVNPVKLNFSTVSNEDCNKSMQMDHFEGDFDASPPLSLD